jgi:molybdate transport system ATP-binding protein
VRQEAGLFPHLSVRRNLEYGLRRTPPERRRVSVEQAIAWLGIGRLLERRPHGLSGGERQRVAIARALLAGPRLLLMDEPLSGLDDASRHEILPYLERLHRGLALPVVYVSHSRAEVLRLADYVVLLEAGRVHASGPVEQIATRTELAPFGSEAELGAVTEAVVVERDEQFGLSYLSFPGGRLGVPAADLRLGERRRLRLLARDVSLALERPRATSILNVIPARVIDIGEADGPLPLVRLDAGGTVLLSRITRRSLQQLEIRPGLRVYAQIKSVALLPGFADLDNLESDTTRGETERGRPVDVAVHLQHEIEPFAVVFAPAVDRLHLQHVELSGKGLERFHRCIEDIQRKTVDEQLHRSVVEKGLDAEALATLIDHRVPVARVPHRERGALD